MTETIRKCSVETCERKHRARGYCQSHYKSRYYPNRKNPTRKCGLSECSSPHHAKGLCYRHYLRDWAEVDSPEVDNSRYSERRCFVYLCGNTAGGRKGLCKAHVNWAGKYGLSPLQAIQILNSGYPCDICGVEITRKTVNMDHDHSCCPGQSTCGSCIRGVLCRSCNRAIGSFGEKQENIRKAIAYLGG